MQPMTTRETWKCKVALLDNLPAMNKALQESKGKWQISCTSYGKFHRLPGAARGGCHSTKVIYIVLYGSRHWIWKKNSSSCLALLCLWLLPFWDVFIWMWKRTGLGSNVRSSRRAHCAGATEEMQYAINCPVLPTSVVTHAACGSSGNRNDRCNLSKQTDHH